jgi:hypothetical protein
MFFEIITYNFVMPRNKTDLTLVFYEPGTKHGRGMSWNI